MAKKPLISVIIPTLNEEKFLPALLESLALQSDLDFEVVVVDGMSQDTTCMVARSFLKKLPSLTLVELKARGIPVQRNSGAQRARGEWLVFSDADNVFMPYFIARVKEYIATHKTQLFTSWSRSDSEKPNDSVMAIFSNLIIEGSIMIKRQFTPGPMTIVHKQAFEKIGGYTFGLSWGEDYDFGKKAYDAGICMSCINEVLYTWSLRRFRHEGSLKVFQQYARGLLTILITKRGLTQMPGYTMGGHIYSRKKKATINDTLKKYELRLRHFVKDVLEKPL